MDRMAHATDLPTEMHAGWLFKKGTSLGSLSGYKKRYFVLMTKPRTALNYFADAKRMELHGTFFLEEAGCRLSSSEVNGKPKSKSKWYFVLENTLEDDGDFEPPRSPHTGAYRQMYQGVYMCLGYHVHVCRKGGA